MHFLKSWIFQHFQVNEKLPKQQLLSKKKLQKLPKQQLPSRKNLLRRLHQKHHLQSQQPKPLPRKTPNLRPRKLPNRRPLQRPRRPPKRKQLQKSLNSRNRKTFQQTWTETWGSTGRRKWWWLSKKFFWTNSKDLSFESKAIWRLHVGLTSSTRRRIRCRTPRSGRCRSRISSSKFGLPDSELTLLPWAGLYFYVLSRSKEIVQVFYKIVFVMFAYHLFC